MRVLVLEDNPERQQVFRKVFPDCVLVSGYADAVAALAGPQFDEVWLDFDIAGFGYNGADVAFFMAQQPRDRWLNTTASRRLIRTKAVRSIACMRAAIFPLQTGSWGDLWAGHGHHDGRGDEAA